MGSYSWILENVCMILTILFNHQEGIAKIVQFINLLSFLDKNMNFFYSTTDDTFYNTRLCYVCQGASLSTQLRFISYIDFIL